MAGCARSIIERGGAEYFTGAKTLVNHVVSKLALSNYLFDIEKIPKDDEFRSVDIRLHVA